jgi:Uri superfamily endonuclease
VIRTRPPSPASARPHGTADKRRRSGLYVVLIEVARAAGVTIGRLGRFRFGPGIYAYVGSARSGLDARVARHFRRRKPRRWHVDWLTSSPACRPLAAVVLPDADLTECGLNAAVGGIVKGTVPVRGFGASDCRAACGAHLWRAGGRVSARSLAGRLGGEVVVPGPRG